MKYTLYCKPGRDFRPGIHCLYLGEWLGFSPDRIILQHGQLSEERAAAIQRFDKVAVFCDARFHTISIECRYNEAYYKRKKELGDDELTQFIGWLYRQENSKIYRGLLEL